MFVQSQNLWMTLAVPVLQIKLAGGRCIAEMNGERCMGEMRVDIVMGEMRVDIAWER